jgi:hypothetical protein
MMHELPVTARLVVLSLVPTWLMASTCPDPLSSSGARTAGNCVYDIALDDRLGAYSAGTGVDHPVTIIMGHRQPLPMGGGYQLSPARAFASVRSWNSRTDYRFDLLFRTLLLDRGFECVPSAWRPAPMLSPLARSDGQVVGLEARFDVDEHGDRFAITVRIVAHGEQFETSAVEVTTTIHNLGSAAAMIGVRYFWDVDVVGSGSLALGVVPPESPVEPWVSGEGEWEAPSFDHLLASHTTRPSTYEPYYFGAISVTGPWTLEPLPTPPEAIVRSYDVSSLIPEDRGGPHNTCFAWEAPDPPRDSPVSSSGNIEAMVYFWGRSEETAISLEPGESRAFTTWFWAFIENPVTCDVGGPYVVECYGRPSSFVPDPTGSHTVEGNPLQYRWSSSDSAVGFSDTRAPQPTVSLPGPGRYLLKLDVGIGPYTRSCETIVDVMDTTPPVLRVPARLVLRTSEHDPGACAIPGEVRAAAEDACSAVVTVTHATEPSLGRGGAVAAYVFPLGTTRVIFSAVDESGNAAGAETTVEVIDDTPPVFTVLEVDPSVLWPPNHHMRGVDVRVEAWDNCTDMPRITLAGVSSSEAADAQGDGRFAPDIADVELGTPDFELFLRAERDGRRTGRTYTLRYLAADDAGNEAEAVLRVRVPHDQRPTRR